MVSILDIFFIDIRERKIVNPKTTILHKFTLDKKVLNAIIKM